MLFILLFSILLGSVLFWALAVEPRRYEISRHKLSLANRLPRPLRILHLSDVHFSKTDPVLGKFFDTLALQTFDLVFLTGDIIDCNDGISFCAENLRKLKPTYGAYAVFGNHDYYDYHLEDMVGHDFPGQTWPKQLQDSDRLRRELESAGVKVLRNATAEIEGGSILIHGLDDPTTGRANIRSTLQGLEPAKIHILLTHSIDALMDIGEREIDLAFSGHSHGGQVCLPRLGAIFTHTLLGKDYVGGIKKYKGTLCSISRGLGASRFLNLRFLCRPEALVLEVS